MIHRLVQCLCVAALVANCQVPNPAYKVGGAEDETGLPVTDIDAGASSPSDAASDFDAAEARTTFDAAVVDDDARLVSLAARDMAPSLDADKEVDAAPVRDTAAWPDAAPARHQVILAVGSESMRLLSYDLGLSWEVNNHAPGAPETRAHFGGGYVGGLFFALGWQVFVSSDARTWQEVTRPYDQWFRSIAYGDGIYMMVGGYGAVAISTNAMSWQKATSPKPVALQSVAYLNGDFAVSNADEEVFVTSDKGANWRLLPGLSTPRVTACDGAFRDSASCGAHYQQGSFVKQGHGVYIRHNWPTSVTRSTDGRNFSHSHLAPALVRDFVFGFVP